MFRWTDEELRQLVTLWPTNSASEIAKRLHRLRSAVRGKAVRLRQEGLLPPNLPKHFDVNPPKRPRPGPKPPPPSVDDSRAQSSRPINPAVTGRPPGKVNEAVPVISAIATERRIATATPPNRLTTQRRLLQVAGAMRTGAAMMRFGSNLYLTELIMVTLLLLGLIVVRSVGPVGEGGRIVTVSEHNKVGTSTENGGRVTSDIGIADLRGSLR